MNNYSKTILKKALNIGGKTVIGLTTSYALKKVWKGVSGKPAPVSIENNRNAITQAVIWAVTAGTVMELVKIISKKPIHRITTIISNVDNNNNEYFDNFPISTKESIKHLPNLKFSR